ncbi:chaplin family protein [Streptomyces sp. NPDC126497]|uniref:chaplin family protein n=1 Tax=Streptomyces sp. NPDC126497 TaxID=3155313 RepID=UPI00331FBB52
MRQTLSRGVFVAAAAATGILSLYGTPALADSYAGGGAEDSHGVMDGNTVGAPVHAPVNVCGNTANAVGVDNDAHDNTCVNGSHGDAEKSADHSHDDSEAAHPMDDAGRSSGIASGNDVRVPVHAPVNVCGDTVNLIGVDNDAYDNTCVNDAHGDAEKSADDSYGDSSHDDSAYGGSAYGDDGAYTSPVEGLPGIASGNDVRVPVHLPVNACGNSVNLIGLFNDAYGNTCVNGGYGEEDEPEKETPTPPVKVKTPPPYEAEKPPAEEEPHGNPPHLAQTGSDGMIAASAAGAVLITGGAMLYRRSRTASRR